MLSRTVLPIMFVPPGAISCGVFQNFFSQKQYVVLTLYCIEQNSPVAAIHRGASRESFSCGSVTSAVISGAVVLCQKTR